MKKLHLAWFGSAAPNIWNKPTGNMYDWRKADIYQDVARLAERAKFDMLLFADTLAVPSTFGGSNDWYVKNGFQIAHDPLPIIAMMAAATSRIGVASTLSSTFYPPFLLARLLATLDHLTNGRVGWNVVTTASKDAAQNFGLDTIIPHDERYDMADEYLALCRQLWDSWEPDAVKHDRESGVFADPSKVHQINFKGKYYKSRGPLNVVSSPQRHPVIIMAGTSPRGQRFAVENADMVIAHKNTVEDMRKYSQSVRKQLADAGRDPRSIKIFFSIKPVMGKTEAEAKERWQYNYDHADMEQGLADLSTTLGFDMSTFDLDKPLPDDLPVQAIMGKLLQIQGMGRPVTLREIAQREGMKETFQICGSYEQTADIIEETARETDADGFHFRSGMQDLDYLVDVAMNLVPILQARGLVRTEYSGNTLRDHLFEF
jgi:FMN-dependent oxidoreductase (nitrilotriacetate monooxygenase family)